MIYASHLKEICHQLCCDWGSAESLALGCDEEQAEKYGPTSVLLTKDRYHGGDQVIVQSIPSCLLRAVSHWR